MQKRRGWGHMYLHVLAQGGDLDKEKMGGLWHSCVQSARGIEQRQIDCVCVREREREAGTSPNSDVHAGRK